MASVAAKLLAWLDLFIVAALWAFGQGMLTTGDFTAAEWLFICGNVLLLARVVLSPHVDVPHRAGIITVVILIAICVSYGEYMWVENKRAVLIAEHRPNDTRAIIPTLFPVASPISAGNPPTPNSILPPTPIMPAIPPKPESKPRPKPPTRSAAPDFCGEGLSCGIREGGLFKLFSTGDESRYQLLLQIMPKATVDTQAEIRIECDGRFQIDPKGLLRQIGPDDALYSVGFMPTIESLGLNWANIKFGDRPFEAGDTLRLELHTTPLNLRQEFHVTAVKIISH
jgi:hypothetical protein